MSLYPLYLCRSFARRYERQIKNLSARAVNLVNELLDDLFHDGQITEIPNISSGHISALVLVQPDFVYNDVMQTLTSPQKVLYEFASMKKSHKEKKRAKTSVGFLRIVAAARLENDMLAIHQSGQQAPSVTAFAISVPTAQDCLCTRVAECFGSPFFSGGTVRDVLNTWAQHFEMANFNPESGPRTVLQLPLQFLALISHGSLDCLAYHLQYRWETQCDMAQCNTDLLLSSRARDQEHVQQQPACPNRLPKKDSNPLDASMIQAAADKLRELHLLLPNADANAQRSTCVSSVSTFKAMKYR